jgi:hypothetical protein
MNRISHLLRWGIMLLLAILSGTAAMPVAAQELLLNRSFETPVVPANGNNFYATIPNWTASNVTPAQALPFNVIKPHAGYANNPTATPTGGGIQYLDINGASGRLSQTVSFPSRGMVDLSGWFSVRDFTQALSGLIINVKNSSGVVVATANTSFVVADPIGLWKLASLSNAPVDAGTYTFEVEMPNNANFDLASLVFKPALTLSKTSVIISDPVSVSNPKAIPGAAAEYTISVASPSSYTVSSDTIFIVDATPANMALVVTDIAGANSGPARFTPGSSTLTYTFTSLASASDDVEFSSNNMTSWTYLPVADASGTDANVTHVRFKPKGMMAASSTAQFKVRYKVQ